MAEPPPPAPGFPEQPDPAGSRSPRAGTGYATDAALAAGARLLPVAIQLAATPFVVGSLGAAGYAIWALLTTTVNLLLTADLGVVAVMQRFTSLHAGARDDAALARVTTTVLSVLGVVLVATIALAPALGALGLTVVDVPAHLREGARFLFSATGVIAALQLIGLALAGHLAGVQRFRAVFVASASARCVLAVGIVVALTTHAGLRGLTLASGADALAAVVTGGIATRHHLATTFRAWLHRAEVAQVWSFAWRGQLAALGFMAQRELDVVLAGVLLPVAQVGAVAAAAQASVSAALFPMVFLLPLLSRLAAVIGARDNQALTAESTTAQRTWLSIVVPYGAMILAVVPFAVPAWAGADLTGAPALAALFLLGLTATLTVSVVATLARALGHPGVEAGAYAGYTAVKLGLGIPGALLFGMWGLAGSTLLASATFVVLVLRLARPVVRPALTAHLPAMPPARVLGRAVAVALVAAMVATVVATQITDRVVTLALLAVVGAVGLVACGLLGVLRTGARS